MEMLNFVYAYVDLLAEIKVVFVSFYFILGWNNLLAKKFIYGQIIIFSTGGSMSHC